MKEQILHLHSQGKSYQEIAQTIPCAISTVWYYCTSGAKQKRNQYKKQDCKAFQKQIKLDFGGKCQICNYDKCLAALEFHHLGQQDKDEILSRLINNLSKKKAYLEAAKCQLLCANCHREQHYPN